MSNQNKQKCFICKQGVIELGKRFFVETDSFLECSVCHSEFHKENGKFLLKNIPDKSSWNKYDGKLLSSDEIKRITKGGLSDFEIEAQYIEDEKQKQKEKEEEAERILREQTPGTPENYFFRYKQILGIENDEDSFELKVQMESEEHLKQYIKYIGQIQKELQQLKKEITATKKQIKSDFDSQKAEINAEAAIYGSSRAMTSIRSRHKQQLDSLRNAQFAVYDVTIKQIDSTVLWLDKAKIEIENQWMGLKIGASNENEKSKKGKSKGSKDIDEAEEPLKLGDILKELDGLTGLSNIKAEVQELINFLKVQEVRKSRNLPTPSLSLHVVFYGNPGTGKTTVARLLSKIYKALGVLSNGHLVETDRSGMVAGYVGQTAIKVSDVAEKALGGVLFIDEAYALTDDDEGGFGGEAINTLIKVMEDHRDDLAVVIAGYTDKMQGFLSTNPGLKSRFNRYWEFKDYIPPELFKIFLSLCSAGHFRLSDSGKRKLAILLQNNYDQRDETFGNGRLVRNIYEATISNQASRIVSQKKISDDALSTIEAEDIPDNVASSL